MFYGETSRRLQDRFDSRRIADRLYATRRRDRFNDDDRGMIAAAPLFVLATADALGRPDCSIKGGEPGFVRIVAENALVFPDYDGNGMFRSLGNILDNQQVGLLFFELGGGRRKLRVNGVASIADSSAPHADFPGAKLLVRVTALDIFPNCPRYLPQLVLTEPSAHNPKRGYVPPEPLWKSKPDLRDFLPADFLGPSMGRRP